MRRLSELAHRTSAPDRRSPARSDPASDDLALLLRQQKRPDPAHVLGLQRTIGNAATARILRDVRRPREWDQKEEEDRDEARRGRQYRRSRDLTGAFETDWAGRALLAHYLYGGGEKVDIRDNSSWTAYMSASELLRKRNQEIVLAMAAEMLNRGKLGRLPTFRRYHAEIENGEGMIGYQYLHGTNKTVGDFEVVGWGEVTRVDQAGVAVVPGRNPYAPDVAMHEGGGKRIDFELTFVWNDIIDPNGKYISDTVKDAIAELISFGEAESYTISIGWRDTCTVLASPKGDLQIIGGYPTV